MNGTLYRVIAFRKDLKDRPITVYCGPDRTSAKLDFHMRVMEIGVLGGYTKIIMEKIIDRGTDNPSDDHVIRIVQVDENEVCRQG